MLCFQIQSRLPSNELSPASCPKNISNWFLKRYHFTFHLPNIILNCLELKLFSFLEMTLQPVYSVHVGVLKELVLHADKEKEPYQVPLGTIHQNNAVIVAMSGMLFLPLGNPRNNKSIHSMKGVPVLFFNSSIDAMLERAE